MPMVAQGSVPAVKSQSREAAIGRREAGVRLGFAGHGSRPLAPANWSSAAAAVLRLAVVCVASSTLVFMRRKTPSASTAIITSEMMRRTKRPPAPRCARISASAGPEPPC